MFHFSYIKRTGTSIQHRQNNGHLITKYPVNKKYCSLTCHTRLSNGKTLQCCPLTFQNWLKPNEIALQTQKRRKGVYCTRKLLRVPEMSCYLKRCSGCTQPSCAKVHNAIRTESISYWNQTVLLNNYNFSSVECISRFWLTTESAGWVGCSLMSMYLISTAVFNGSK